MPFYDYSCPNCGNIKEDVLHSIKELVKPSKELVKETTCNDCGIRMKQCFISAPSVSTPTSKEYLTRSRKQRNKNHFKKEVLPTIADKDSKNHHIRKLGYKN